MIGVDLEGAHLESRVVSSLRPHRTLLREHSPGLYVPIPRHHRHRRTWGRQGNKPGNDHDPRYRRDATSASPAAVRSGTHGGLWKITQYIYQQLPEQSEGAAPASSGSATGFGHVPHPLAVAEHDAVPAVTLIYLPVQGPGR
jgi:hypothetical protein